MDLPDKKGFIIEKIVLKMPLLEVLCSNLLWHSLSDIFEISKGIALVISSASPIPGEMRVKSSAVNLDERHSYCLSLMKFFCFLRWSTTFLFMTQNTCWWHAGADGVVFWQGWALNSILVYGAYCWHLPNCWETFYLCQNWRELCAKVLRNSHMNFIWTFVESRLLISLENYRAEIEKLQSSVKWVKSYKGCRGVRV